MHKSKKEMMGRSSSTGNTDGICADIHPENRKGKEV